MALIEVYQGETLILAAYSTYRAAVELARVNPAYRVAFGGRWLDGCTQTTGYPLNMVPLHEVA